MDLYKNFLKDLIILIKDEALEAKQEYLLNKGDYPSGYLMAFNFVISLIQSQAEAFNIDLKEINLSDVDPDNDLTPIPGA